LLDIQREKAPVLCVLGLGSNRSYNGLSCEEILSSAIGELQKTLMDLRCSPLYKTAPLHVTDQSPFYNAAVSGYFVADTKDVSIVSNSQIHKETSKEVRELLAITQAIEAMYGRDRSIERRWGERSLDIDILLFGDVVISDNGLIIPHPRLTERAFALRPLVDLLPHAVEPGTGIPYRTILESLPQQEIEIM